MNEENKIEKLVGDAMEKHRVHPPAGMQDAIREKLIEKNLLEKRKKAGFRFLWLSVLVVGLATSGYFVIQKYGVNTNSSQNSALEKEKTSLQEEIGKKENGLQKMRQTVRENILSIGHAKTGLQAEIENDKIRREEATNTGTSDDMTNARQEHSALQNRTVINKNEDQEIKPRGGVEENSPAKNSSGRSTVKKKESVQIASVNQQENNNATTGEKPAANAVSLSDKANRPDENKLLANASSKGNKNKTDGKQMQETPAGNDGDNNTDQNPPQIKEETVSVAGEDLPFAESPGSVDINPPKKRSIAASPNETEQVNPGSSNAAPANTDSAQVKTSLPDTVTKTKPGSSSKLSVDLSAGPQFTTFQYRMNGSANHTYYELAKHSEETKPALAVNLAVNVQLSRILVQAGIGTYSLNSDAELAESTFTVDTTGRYEYRDSTYSYIDTSTMDTVTVTFHLDST
jgi:hypothetical protein